MMSYGNKSKSESVRDLPEQHTVGFFFLNLGELYIIVYATHPSLFLW